MTYRLPATVTSCHDALLPTDALLINFTSSARPRETRKREMETSRRGGISRGRDNRALMFVVDEPCRGRRLPPLPDLSSGFDEVSWWSSRVWTFLFYFFFLDTSQITLVENMCLDWFLILKCIVKYIVSINCFLYIFLILHFGRKVVYFDLLLCIFITMLHYLFWMINKFDSFVI